MEDFRTKYIAGSLTAVLLSSECHVTSAITLEFATDVDAAPFTQTCLNNVVQQWKLELMNVIDTPVSMELYGVNHLQVQLLLNDVDWLHASEGEKRGVIEMT